MADIVSRSGIAQWNPDAPIAGARPKGCALGFKNLIVDASLILASGSAKGRCIRANKLKNESQIFGAFADFASLTTALIKADSSAPKSKAI